MTFRQSGREASLTQRCATFLVRKCAQRATDATKTYRHTHLPTVSHPGKLRDLEIAQCHVQKEANIAREAFYDALKATLRDEDRVHSVRAQQLCVSATDE